MKTRDVFSGCSVTIMVIGDRWAVGFIDEDAKNLAVSTYASIDDALEVSRRWLALLRDDTEVLDGDLTDREEVVADVRTTVAQELAGEQSTSDGCVLDALREREELRTWFRKQLGVE